jgi:hypothetical protein
MAEVAGRPRDSVSGDVENAPMAVTSRLRRWLRRLLILGVLLVVGLVVAYFVVRAMLPGFVEVWLHDTVEDATGIELEIDEIELDLQRGYAKVTGIEATLGDKPLASVAWAEVTTDVQGLIDGDDEDIKIVLHELRGEIRNEPENRLNLALISDTIAERQAEDDGSPPSPQRLTLTFETREAVFQYSDDVSDPSNPLRLSAIDTDVVVARLPVQGPDRTDELMDVYVAGLVEQPEEPAMFAFGMWTGPDDTGTYLEAHAAVTGFDGRQIPQYVTPGAKRILGGYMLHGSGTMVAHGDVIEQGLIEVEVEGRRTSLPLRFAGRLGEPQFDMDSPMFQVFRLGWLRVADSGDTVWRTSKDVGASIWRRSSGVFTESAKGIGEAVSELSIRKLGEGLWRGLKGLFGGEPEKEERLERWIEYAKRQIAFRELTVLRRYDVAKEREPQRMEEIEEWIADEPWMRQVEDLREAAGYSDDDLRAVHEDAD